MFFCFFFQEKQNIFLNILCYIFFSSLEEDPLYIAYADMMAKVLIFFFALTQSPSVQQNPAGVSSCSLFQSCAEGEEEEDEEGKEKTFEVPVISQEHCFAFLFSLH